jgi:hypothetical protein
VDDAPETPQRSTRRRWLVGIGVLVLALIGAGVAGAFARTTRSNAHGDGSTQQSAPSRVSGRGAPAYPTTTSSTLPLPGPGFVPGAVTAVGDSVMLDYQDALQFAFPQADIDAAVSRQWGDGESILSALKSEQKLGAEVVVGLGTNGPITDADFDSMMSLLQGASRVVFVNVHVDRPWQDPNNAVLARGAARYPNVVVADWATLANQNPQWFGADGTHLPIDGSGAAALAALVANEVVKG